MATAGKGCRYRISSCARLGGSEIRQKGGVAGEFRARSATKAKGGRNATAKAAAEKALDSAKKLYESFDNKGHWTALKIITHNTFAKQVFPNANALKEADLSNPKTRNAVFFKRYNVGLRRMALTLAR